MTEPNRFTAQSHWDDYWNNIELPLEIRKSRTNLYLNEILKVFDEYLPKHQNLSILEIGGAPGQYLVYMKRNFHYRISALDYSEVGCRKLEQNFELLKIEGVVYRRDLFSALSDLPKFDIVYSLGFVEHFSNLTRVIEKHLELLKPHGLLLVGAPNLLGINRLVLRRLDPERLSRHNLLSMDIRQWSSFEEALQLKTIFKGYIGGFEPSLYRCVHRTLLNRAIHLFCRAIKRCITDRFAFLRRFNSQHWSGYILGIYQKGDAGH